tara:strand:+ start:304 stop:3501 length:3198 start_codon:yes stop_codon:yes gene_type:complete
MSNDYVDTKLLNCNRLASTEARSGNDSNPAVFTNPLNETVRLNVGDKVSLERAFISEVGAGNPQTIEFKGESVGTNNVPTYTDIDYGNKFYEKASSYIPRYRLGYYQTITTTIKSDETVELRDNLAPLIFGYYITSNEYPNYIQQPRRFAQTSDTRGSVPSNYNHYTAADSTTNGMTYNTINTNAVCFADWVKKLDVSAGTIYKQKVDNTRYTLFIKDKIAYVGGHANAADQFPKQFHNGLISECTYHRIRERKDIEVKKGFNTPSAIATQITKQLTETRNEDIFEILDGTSFSRPITKTIETTTYKPINAQNLYNFNSGTLTDYLAVNLPTDVDNVSQGGIDYVATFGYIGVKRPEIFEKGREMAELPVAVLRNFAGDTIAPHPLTYSNEGFQFVGTYENTSIGGNVSHTFTTNLEYTEENCKKIREYFDTQVLYPELWDGLQDTEYYSLNRVETLGGLTLPDETNSRFFHINQYTTTGGVGVIHNETFGDDSFSQRGAPNNIEMTSVPWFSYYDDNFRDTFIPPRVWMSIAQDGLSYGFAQPVKYTNYDADGNEIKDFYLIGITNHTVAGTPKELFSENVVGNTGEIKFGRRIGFDFHATAYSTAIITPYAGYSNVDIGTLSTTNTGAEVGGALPAARTYTDTINHIKDLGNAAQTTDLMPYMTMTYIGANNPEVFYNTTNNRFEFKRLHTGNNIGNRFKAGNGADSLTSTTMEPPHRQTRLPLSPPDANIDAGDTVYKINPRPPQFGYSPTFKPYHPENFVTRVNCYPANPTVARTEEASKGTNMQIYNKFNENIRPYTAFDSHGGVYIDNWGFTRETWTDNLWDILGYDFDATNAQVSSKNVLTQRVDNENSGALYRPTTNAEVVTTDTKAYISNQFGVSQYYTSLPYPSCCVDYTARTIGGNDLWTYSGDTSGTGTGFTAPHAQPEEIFDEVAIKTESTTITATDLQKSVLRPYYTIRSNILEGATAIGGNPTGANLPIISIVDKYSGASDYFLGNPSDIQFTVTKPTVIADITTSIHDSDGRYANVNRTSAVVYKIEKVKQTPTGIIEEIMQGNKKEKK